MIQINRDTNSTGARLYISLKRFTQAVEISFQFDGGDSIRIE